MLSTARGRTVAAVVALLSGAAAAALFLTRFRPALLLFGETLRPAVGAAGVLLASIAAGDLALRAARRAWTTGNGLPLPAAQTAGDAYALSELIAVGFVTFGTAVGIVSLLTTTLVMPLTVAASAAGAYVLLGRREMSVRLPPIEWPLVLLVIPVAIALAEAAAPVNSPDEMVYKLAVPHAWALYGRMLELPLNSNSYLAMAFQASDLAALLVGGGIAAKLAHFGLYLAVLAIVRRFAGTLAVIALAWTPALMTISGWAWVEWGVLGLLVFSYARYEQGDWPAAAAAAGCAAAAKYTALPWLAAFAVVLIVRRTPARILLRGAVIAAAFGVFFYARNTVWTGSPVAPLLLPNAPHVQNYTGSSGWSDLVRGAAIVDVRIIDESLGIVLTVFALAGLFAWRRRRDLVLIGLLQMPVLLTIAPGSRNMVNGVAALAIAGAGIVEEVFAASAVVLQRGAAIVLAIALATQLVLVGFVLAPYDLPPYLAGRENGREYIVRLRDFASAYDWIARATPPAARLLLLAENRTYYLDRQFISGGNLDGPRVSAWLSAFATPEAMLAALRAEGVTHVLLHKPWYRIAGMPGPAPTMIEREFILEVPPKTHAILTQMLNTHSALRYRDRGYLIYELR